MSKNTKSSVKTSPRHQPIPQVKFTQTIFDEMLTTKTFRECLVKELSNFVRVRFGLDKGVTFDVVVRTKNSTTDNSSASNLGTDKTTANRSNANTHLSSVAENVQSSSQDYPSYYSAYPTMLTQPFAGYAMLPQQQAFCYPHTGSCSSTACTSGVSSPAPIYSQMPLNIQADPFIPEMNSTVPEHSKISAAGSSADSQSGSGDISSVASATSKKKPMFSPKGGFTNQTLCELLSPFKGHIKKSKLIDTLGETGLTKSQWINLRAAIRKFVSNNRELYNDILTVLDKTGILPLSYIDEFDNPKVVIDTLPVVSNKSPPPSPKSPPRGKIDWAAASLQLSDSENFIVPAFEQITFGSKLVNTIDHLDYRSPARFVRSFCDTRIIEHSNSAQPANSLVIGNNIMNMDADTAVKSKLVKLVLDGFNTPIGNALPLAE